MSWAKIDDQLHGHRKILRAWKHRPALGLHFMALSYGASHDPRGFVPAEWVEEKLPNARERERTIAVLTDVPPGFTAGLWEPVDGGWNIHDWDEYNGDARTREEIRAAKSEAGKKGAAEKWRKDRITQTHRQRVAGRLGATAGDVMTAECAYCSTPLTVDWSDPGRVRFFDADGKPTPELDHVEALFNGGAHDADNLALACLSCNRRKGTSLAPASALPETSPGTDIAPSPYPSSKAKDSPVVVGRAPAAEGLQPSLAEKVVGVLQRGIDGLTTDAGCKRPSVQGVDALLAEVDADELLALSVATEVRSIAQSQNRAPNLEALYGQKLRLAAANRNGAAA